MLGFLEARPGGPVLLAGFSYGAYLAAAVGRRRPDLVVGLLLVCGGVRVAAEHRTLPDAPLPEVEPDWSADVPADLRGHLRKALARPSRPVASRLARLLAAPGDDALRDRLRSEGRDVLADEDADVVVDRPVSVVVGRQDRVVGFADQLAAMRHYPRGSYLAVDGAGHYLPVEQPADFREAVHAWVARCRSGG